MIEFRYFQFSANPPPTADIKRLLAKVDIPRSNGELKEYCGLYTIRLPILDPRVPRLVEALDALSFDPPWHYHTDVEYDRADLEPAEYVELHVNRAPNRSDTGPLHGTDYDISDACPECGTPARQVSPLRLSRGVLPKKARALRTYNGEILIDHELAIDIMLEVGGARGLRQVEDRKLLCELPWWQILPDTAMPPADPCTPYTVDAEGQCKRCRRDGFGPPMDMRPLEFHYRMSPADRRAMPDFVYTWEHFGVSMIKYKPGHVIRFASPRILVSNRAMRVFWRKKVRGLRFTPARFI